MAVTQGGADQWRTGARAKGAGMNRVVKESGDFTAEFRLVGISAIAVVIGAVCAVLALVLLRLIELFTNLFYFQEWSFRLHLPASSTLAHVWGPST